MKKKTKTTILLIVLYFVIVALAFIFVPTLLAYVLFPLAQKGFETEGLYLADWSFVDAKTIVACIFLWFAFTILYLFTLNSSNWKKNRGDEYGSARLMTDEEFDDILPNYIFEKDEQNIDGPVSVNPPEKIDEADKVVFDYFEYEEVNDYE